MQLCGIIYYFLAALHVSSDIFAHHQEHLNSITASGITHVCRCRLASWECWHRVRVVKSRRMRWAWHVARMGDDRGVHKMLVGKPEGQSPLGRPRRRWEDNIKINLQEVGGGRGDWMELAQDRAR